MLKSLFIMETVIILFANGKLPQKIIGGEVVRLNEFPFIASIRVDGHHICSGSIISSRHILTAAHCIFHLNGLPHSKLSIVTGTISLASGGQSHVVKVLRYHGGFNSLDKSSPNDLAIVELGEPLIFNAVQNKIPIVSSLIQNGSQAVTVGWGLSDVNQPFLSYELRKVSLETLKPEQCQQFFSTKLWTHQICAKGVFGRGTCVGDSGGPLIYNNQLVGVISYGAPCANGKPDVYTSIYHYRHWISTNIAD